MSVRALDAVQVAVALVGAAAATAVVIGLLALCGFVFHWLRRNPAAAAAAGVVVAIVAVVGTFFAVVVAVIALFVG